MSYKYDAVLLVSFGGPEGPDDVMPFLENVLRGKNVPRERMLEVAEHYNAFGGVSPINEQNRQLIAALKEDFQANNVDLPIYWGNRNWDPMLPDTLREMAADGVKSAIALFTSAYSSYSGCRQYRENIAEAQKEVGPDAPQVDKARAFFNHPGFVEANIIRMQEALEKLGGDPTAPVTVLFTAHSIPMSMADNCKYSEQLLETSRLIAEACNVPAENWSLVYQSRSGPPQQPWLEPDVCDALKEKVSAGAKRVVIAPIGFISDHMEVIYDLDHEAADAAKELGIDMVRAGTVGTHPRFVAALRELVLERATDTEERPVLGNLPPKHDVCPLDCCTYTPRRPPAARPG